ncbi:RNA-directed DNA polymerase [Amycolatopsis sp. SID8362]|uniref:reverse transcriptase family protein n=1 Tax=Amycolatopsis sp. SID8362 TaxID=2690346 RepID=UPI00136A1DAA|nr:RNA-directed DNA polymerase [Amycolatopsis sp. SID8362]NED43486.1 RNA-directed DNA polymerase [Amycolatopsis sp. SID8362]
MITDSPHLYRRNGVINSVPEEVLSNSLMQAGRVEQYGLASILTLKHLAVQARSSYGFLRGIVERKFDPYTDIKIKRTNGRIMRPVSSPSPGLMPIQRWILAHIVSRLGTHPNSFAYTRNKSIKSCASKHLGANWLVRLDVQNFFESIDESSVYRVFAEAGYQPLAAFELARICTRYAPHAHHVDAERFRSKSHYATIRQYNMPYMGFVPQGAPTSGALANLVAKDLDLTLTQVAEKYGAAYTRYSDDMTFSSTSKFTRSKALSLIEESRTALFMNGFRLHDKKTQIQPPGARKTILGLLVDGDSVHLNKRIRSRIENHVRGAEKFGLRSHYSHVNFASLEGFVNHVSGLIAFWLDIDPENSQDIQKRWKETLRRDGWHQVDYWRM